MTLRTFTGTFRDSTGAARIFHLEAEDHNQAEGFARDLIASGARIDGELIAEGEAEAVTAQGKPS
ncbi:hypothetical protein [Phenylobacterium sp.]|uniref:hypothetical protein n=1 Tax=Phenylobacterium sp. TaxID=1871053 RepID=UPI002620DCF4|nr:hypothetical protein [Phenylobacterium sp.]